MHGTNVEKTIIMLLEICPVKKSSCYEHDVPARKHT